jgi:hypothetical protein
MRFCIDWHSCCDLSATDGAAALLTFFNEISPPRFGFLGCHQLTRQNVHGAECVRR